MLTGVVSFVIIGSTVVVLVAVLTGQTENIKSAAEQIGELTQGVLAIIVGYVGGRGASALSSPKTPETIMTSDPPPEP